MLRAIYKNRCPRCLGDITSIRLSKGEFCDKCMREIKSFECEELGEFKRFCIASKKLEDFEEFFYNKTSNHLTSIQKMWAKRFFLDNSFALLAPTGIGKSTFGILLSAFVKNSYIILPTKLLVIQTLNKLKEFGIEVLAYTGRKEEKEKIKRGEYNILITTTQFLYKNKGIINKTFKLVFVDDVDSILKSGKKIEDVLKLLGFSEEDLKRAFELIEKKEYEKLSEIANKRRGNLLVSSATANPKSKRVLLFKYLLGFEVSKPNLSLRNIEDLYDENFSWESSIEWIKKLGRGGLLFLPGNETKERLKEYIEFLTQSGIKAYSYEEFDKHLEEFKRGECYFVGFASYRNPLARGIDLPEAIRYTLFVGVPKMEFNLSSDDFKGLYFILLSLFPYLFRKRLIDSKKAFEIQNYINLLKKYIFWNYNLPNERLEKIVKEVRELIREYEEEIKSSPEISFDGEKIVTADITGYIQASGRASRFYKGHLTKGVALVLVDNQKAFYSLRKKLKWFSEAEFKKVLNVNLDEILREVDESRKVDKRLNLKTSFVIVESPTKAKTISSFFGKPSKRIINGVSVWEILLEDRVLLISASIGHDFDLSEKEGVFGVVDKYVPVFRVLEEKDRILDAFNLTSSEVDEIFVATDPDREGEKISFDLSLDNKPYNLKIKRAEFHEITKYAFKEALENPREVDLNLVAAQFVRRILDRWVGFKVSLYLQKLLHNPHLSAGRVQTPVLKWICDRTLKLREKVYVVRVEFDDVRVEFEFDKKEEARKFYEEIKEIEVKKIEERKEELFEMPFNTSEMLKEASVKLKFTPQKTMNLAQELFEMGFITYHRTDSHRISSLGMKIAKEYIKENFGDEFVKSRSFEVGGAHEAIRATTSMDKEDLESFALSKGIELSFDHLRLYDLIFRKFIASQMREVEVKKEIFKILNKKEEFVTQILRDGFNLIYPIKVFDIKEGIKKVKKSYFEKSKYPPFTYADIIEMMKKRGIGRPSTYGITIEKLLDRGYVVEKNGYLFATRLGFKVIKIVYNSSFSEFVSEEFTAKLEEIMDEIEKGERDYKEELIRLFSLLF
ncbi:MAG: reverse gyrase [Nautiliaceae bacterium]